MAGSLASAATWLCFQVNDRFISESLVCGCHAPNSNTKPQAHANLCKGHCSCPQATLVSGRVRYSKLVPVTLHHHHRFWPWHLLY